MSDNKTLVELCTASIVNLVKAQDNQSLPHRLPEPVKARKSIGHDGRWEFGLGSEDSGKEYKSWPVGEVITNIDSTRWNLGVHGEEEEWVFENSCNRIAACFGCTCYFHKEGGTVRIEILPVYADR